MSTSVDQRVVQMKFDNKSFEQNASQTMSTLDKLKEKLHFSGAGEGLETLNKKIHGISLGTLSDGVHQVELKLNTLSLVATKVMSGMVTDAINAGKRMTEALTIKPVTEGFSEYELKMGSIQTIMASTGEDLQKVTAYLNELNTYSDRTIYSFSDMTSSIGKFTNAGVKLDDAVTAIKGISNEAAVSGANAQEASRAMYNFAQALSAGYVKLIDWKSIENANMATVEFKQTLIDTAVELGTVVKVGEDYQTVTKDNNGHVSDLFNSTKNFNDALSAQWMTTDVLVNTLRKYTDETTDLGKKAYAAAQDVKTFTQLMDTMKEAVGSGWAETWEIVFGDFNEAKELWTGVNNIVGDFISTMSDARNQLLRGGLSTGWKQITAAGIKDAKAYEQEIINVASTHVENLDEMIKESGSFEKSLKAGWVTSKDLGDALDNIVNKTKDMSAAELESIGFTEDVRDSFIDFQNKVKDGTISLEEFAAMLAQDAGRENLIEAVHNAFLALMSILTPVKQALIDVFHGPTADGIYDFTKSVRDFTEGLILSNEASGTLRITLKLLLIPLNLIFQAVRVGITAFFRLTFLTWQLIAAILTLPAKLMQAEGPLEKLFGHDRYEKVVAGLTNVMSIFSKVLEIIDNKLGSLVKSFKGFQLYIPGLEALKAALEPLGEFILDQIANGFQMLAEIDITKAANAITSPIKWIKDALGMLNDAVIQASNVLLQFFIDIQSSGPVQALINLGNKVSTFVEILKSMGKSGFDIAFEKVKFVLQNIYEVLEPLGLALTNFAGRLDASRILVYAFGVALTGLMIKSLSLVETLSKVLKAFGGVATSFSGMMKSITGTMGALQKKLKGNKIAETAKAITMLAVAVGVLALLPRDKVEASLVTILKLMAGLTIMSVTMAAISKFLLSSESSIKAMKALNTNLLAMSAAIAILSASLLILSNVNDEGLWSKMLKLGAMFAALIVAIGIIGKMGLQTKISGMMVLFTSLAIVKLVDTLQKLSNIDMTGIQANIGLLAEIVLGLIAVGVASSKASLGGGLGLTLVVADILLVIKALEELSNMEMKFPQILAAIAGIAAIFVAFAFVLQSLDKAGPYAIQAGVSILAMSLAINLLQGAIRKLAEANDDGTLLKGGLAVSAFFILFAMIVEWTKNAGAHGAQAGAMILEFSVALLALQLVVAYLGGLDSKTLIKGVAAVSVLMVIFGMTAQMAGMVQKSTTTIIAMAAAIGVLSASLALLTLLDGDKLLISAASLSATLLALSKAMQMLESMKIGSAIASVVYLGVMIGGLTASLILLSNLNTGNMVAAAISLSATLLALSASTKLLQTLDFKAAASTAGVMLIFMGEVTAALFILQNVDPAASIVNAVSLSLLLNAMAVATKLMKGMDFKSGIASAVSMGLMLAAIVIALNFLKDYDASDMASKLTSLSVALLAMSVVTAILSVAGNLAGAAVAGAVALDLVLAAVAVVVAAFGKLNEDGNFAKLIDSGATIFTKLGNVIGRFIGNVVGGLLGGIGGGVLGSLPGLGVALSGFSVAIAPFLSMLDNVDDAKMNAIGSITTMITSLTSASILDGIARFFGGGESSLTKFASELSSFAPAFVSFVQTISSANIDVETVNAAAACGNAMAELAKNLPASGGILQEWFGEKDLGKFGLQLAAFGAGIVGYYQALTVNGPIDFELVESSAKAAEMLAQLAGKLPSSGGILQEWFGEKDLGLFGTKIKQFGQALAEYSSIVSAEGAINYDAVESSTNAAQLLVNLANNLPSTGGKLQEWIFGEQNLRTFGQHLKDFGQAIVDYSDIISKSKISLSAVAKSVYVGQSLAALQDSLPETGGILGAIFGDKKLDRFAENMQAFGEGIKAFYEAIGNFEGTTIDPLKTITEAGQNIGQALADGIASKNDLMKTTGVQMMTSFSDAIKTNTETVKTTFAGIATSAMTTIRTKLGIVGESSTIFNSIGKQVMQGLIDGLNSRKVELNNTMRVIADGLATTTDDELEVASPSKRFTRTGQFLIQGLINGVKEYSPKANDAMTKMSQGVMDATNSYFEINSPSVKMEEVGHYLVMGIAEGITKDMTAEEAAKKKAENITQAFEDEMQKYINSKDIRGKEFDLWEGLHSDASEKEINDETMNRLLADLEDQKNIVAAAQGDYQTMVKTFGKDSEEANQAYSDYLDRQKELLDLSKQMSELEQTMYGTQQENLQKQHDANAEYRRLLQEEGAALISMGYTAEQVQKWAQQQSGWDPNAVAENAANQARTVKEIFDSYMMETSVEIDQKTAEIVTNSMSNGLRKGGQQAGNQVGEGIKDSSGKIGQDIGTAVGNAANQADYSQGATGVVEGFLNAINSKIKTVGDAGAGFFNVFNDGFNSEAEINSPSKRFYDNGVFIVEGLMEGVESEYPELATYMKDFLEGMEWDFDLGGQTLGEAIINGIKDAIQNGSPDVQNAIQGVVEGINLQTQQAALDKAVAQANKQNRNLGGGGSGDDDWKPNVGANWRNEGGNDNEIVDPFGRNKDGIWVDFQNMTKFEDEEYTRQWEEAVHAFDNATEEFKDTVVEAFKDVTSNNYQKAEDTASASKISVAGTGKSLGTPVTTVNNTYTFNQTNNSPKAISRADTYRDSKNLFSQIKTL